MVKRSVYVLFQLMIVLVLVCGCAPSAEEVATLTAAAASPTPSPTATPEPTPTATPIPYALSVMVLNMDGEGIEGAIVNLEELTNADGASILTNDSGVAGWTDLPGENVTLEISAPGYFSVNSAHVLQRGTNEIEVTLDRDPHGLLASNACNAGESLIYIEDLQDEKAQGWTEIMFNASGWSIEQDPEAEGNLVIVARQGAPWVWLDRENITLNNSVWRLNYQYTGNAVSHFNFRFVEDAQSSNRYMYVGGSYTHLQRLTRDLTVGLKNFNNIKPGTWHQLEIGYFDGVLSIYLDGDQLVEYSDPEPWSGGTINLEPYPRDPNEAVLYDNIVLCELFAPMQSIMAVEP